MLIDRTTDQIKSLARDQIETRNHIEDRTGEARECKWAFLYFLDGGWAQAASGREGSRGESYYAEKSPSMLAQSNKLVGITRAAESVVVQAFTTASSSPPISGALSRAGSTTYMCVYIFHVGFGISLSENFVAVPLAGIAMIPRFFQGSCNSLVQHREIRDL